jgi:inner membrane protein
MENLCHTFFGAALAKAGLERVTPLALPTLLIGANLPDIDVVARFEGPLAYLRHHRGITHSIVGLMALSMILPVLMLLFDRLVRQRIRRDADPARFRGLLLVSLIALASHPLLDYTNPYGIRPFLPWSGRWYYGDLVFIVDPWLWLILGGAVFFLTSQTQRRIIAWGMLAGLLTLIVLGAHIALTMQRQEPMSLAWLWLLLLGAVIIARWYGVQRHGAKLATAALVATVVYWSLLMVAHHIALEHVLAISRAAASGEATTKQAALPRPATPLAWDGFFESPGDVFYGMITLTSNPGAHEPMSRYPKRLDDPLVHPALQTCAGATLLEFARYPFAVIEPQANGYTVILRDARFEREQRSGFAVMAIPVDEPTKSTPGTAHRR